MTLVVDASIVCKWLVEEEGSAGAAKILGLGETLVAPDFVTVEVCDVLWKKQRSGEISTDHAEAAMASVSDFFDELLPCQAFSRQALDMAIDLDHPVAGCFYLAVAEKYDCSYVTADSRLLDVLAGSTRAGLAITPDCLEIDR